MHLPTVHGGLERPFINREPNMRPPPRNGRDAAQRFRMGIGHGNHCMVSAVCIRGTPSTGQYDGQDGA